VIKIVMAIIVTSMPNWPSVKYQGYIYQDMETCIKSNEMYVQQFKDYAASQGDYDAHFESFCLPIESYPIEGFNNKINL
jgi:hypothetical protein